MERNLFLRTANKVVDQSIDKDRDRYVCVNAYVSKEQRNTRIIKQFKGIDKRAKEKTWWIPRTKVACECYWAISNSVQPHGLEPTRILHPWNIQARILEWVAITHFRGSSDSDQTYISCVSCNVRQILYHCTTWEAN